MQYIPEPMDIIFLNDLRIDTVIGIFDWERRTKQTVIFDIEMAADISKAARSDNVEDTVNYKAVAKRLIGYVSEAEFELIESLAESVAGILLDEFKVPWCRLRLNKRGAVRGARDVGIIIERGSRN